MEANDVGPSVHLSYSVVINPCFYRTFPPRHKSTINPVGMDSVVFYKVAVSACPSIIQTYNSDTNKSKRKDYFILNDPSKYSFFKKANTFF